jgi:hypothetical protein
MMLAGVGARGISFSIRSSLGSMGCTTVSVRIAANRRASSSVNMTRSLQQKRRAAEANPL